jgi:hypothetical protein
MTTRPPDYVLRRTFPFETRKVSKLSTAGRLAVATGSTVKSTDKTSYAVFKKDATAPFSVPPGNYECNT